MDNRIDFIYLFDVVDGNPNGDPDMNNAPRSDPETNQGLVTDVCLKRKIRNYVLAKNEVMKSDRHNILITQGASLESKQKLPFENIEELKGKEKERENDILATNWMCNTFFDVRTFGAVMNTTNCKCGQVLGAIQLTFARSIDPILITEHSITRMCQTNEEKQKKGNHGTFGDKHTVAYGLYKAYGFYNPLTAKQVGFDSNDFELLIEALQNMFDLDRSAARGKMSCQGIIVFEHNSYLGNAPAQKLFDLVDIRLKDGTTIPRSFDDYIVSVKDNPYNVKCKGYSISL